MRILGKHSHQLHQFIYLPCLLYRFAQEEHTPLMGETAHGFVFLFIDSFIYLFIMFVCLLCCFFFFFSFEAHHWVTSQLGSWVVDQVKENNFLFLPLLNPR